MGWKNTFLAGTLFLGLLVVFAMWLSGAGRGKGAGGRRPKVLYTATCFFDFSEDKFGRFCDGMDGLIRQEGMDVFRDGRIARVLVVNECPHPTTSTGRDWKKEVRARYPFVEFVQKQRRPGANPKSGQAESLNLLLRELKRGGYDYWLHVEEAWKPFRPFFDRALDVMERNPTLTQLQMNADAAGNPRWADWGAKHLRSERGHVRVLPKPDGSLLDGNAAANAAVWNEHPWPLFTLNPAFTRVSHLEKAGLWSFDENPAKWPVQFEFDFGARFVAAGCEKAYLVPTAFTRDWDNHASTYGSNSLLLSS